MGQSTRVLVQRCPGLLPSIRHFENRRGEGPGDEVDLDFDRYKVGSIKRSSCVGERMRASLNQLLN